MLFPGIALQTANRQLLWSWRNLLDRIRRTIECYEPTNATGAPIPVATIVGQGTTANQIAPSADDANEAKFTGVTEEAIADDSKGLVRYSGPCRVKFDRGLTITAGETAFVGHLAGYATNVAPTAVGTYARPLGTILDASNYVTAEGGTCVVMLAQNADVIQTPIG